MLITIHRAIHSLETRLIRANAPAKIFKRLHKRLPRAFLAWQTSITNLPIAPAVGFMWPSEVRAAQKQYKSAHEKCAKFMKEWAKYS